MSDVNHSQMNYSPEEIEHRAELLLCHVYPNYCWGAEVNRATGQLEIKNYHISFDKGMSINLFIRRTASELEKKIKDYGGELLERANLPRVNTEENLAIFLANAEREFNQGRTLIGLDKS